MIILDILNTIGVLATCGVAIWGINSWRRETKWKRKYELAEEILASLYESQQDIRSIRSPIGLQNEGNSRKAQDNETPEQTRIYNQAYSVRERFKNNSAALIKLHSLKYRFMALFGKEYEEHFNQFSKTVNSIFFAAEQIAFLNLGEYGDDKEFKLKILEDNNQIIYASILNKNEDKVEIDIQNAVDAIEAICASSIGKIKN
ncbi:hypothetical protein BZARG_2062 [Bizionia argentinensis JUB59]|uniref:Uncharacterized protein n=1 Tax=Bizionia argentinensis JUB59 TaxID=1046627 RepID=G2EFC8_9FLAO|nr:hypothetical protein [Bizionia argentinensis]EGV42876.1 hypothetical protein BZARG_2062 [Bizionia argentinensis JUB59]